MQGLHVGGRVAQRLLVKRQQVVHQAHAHVLLRAQKNSWPRLKDTRSGGFAGYCSEYTFV